MPQPQIQVLPIPLGGIDESTAPSLLPAGKMVEVVNATMLAGGTWEPRPGFAAIAATTRAGTATMVSIFCRGSEVYGLATDGWMYQWSGSELYWEKQDRYAEAQICETYQGERGLVDPTYSTSAYCDAVMCGQYLVTVQGVVATGGIAKLVTRVTDTLTGTRHPAQVFDYHGLGARLLTYSSRVYLIYLSARDTIKGRILDTSVAPLTWGAAITLVADVNAAHPIWEAAISTSNVWLAYNQDGGAPAGKICKFDQSLLAVSSQATVKYALAAWAIACDPAGAALTYAACDDSAGAGVICYAADYASLALGFGGSHVVVDGSADVYKGALSRVRRMAFGVDVANKTVRLFFDLINAVSVAPANLSACLRSKRITFAGVVSLPINTENVSLISQVQYNATLGKYYVWAALADKPWHQYTHTSLEPIPPATTPTTVTDTLPRLQGTAFLLAHDLDTVDRGPARVACRAFPLTVADMGVARCTSFGASFAVAIPRLSEAEHGTDPGFDVAQVRFFSAYDFHALSYGSQVILTGGVPQSWDGNHLVELGWHYYPRITAPIPSNSTGTLANSGVYSYKAVYTWIDNQGNRHYSASSLPCSVTMGAADDTVTITVDNLTLTSRQDWDDQLARVEIEIYRTINAGTEYHLVTRLANDPTTAEQTFVDTIGDSTLEILPMIEDRGGKWAAGCTPALRHIVSHQQRLFGVRADDPAAVVFGHPTLRGDAPRIPDGWELRSGDGGKYTALGSLDDRLLAFQEGGVDCIWGQGPNEQGLGQVFQEPQMCARVAGCFGPHAIARYPQGYFYVGKAGAWSVDASLQPQYRSGPIQLSLDTQNGGTVVRHVFLDESNYRLLLSVDIGGIPMLLTWHYRYDAWATWQILNPSSNLATITSISCQTQSGYPHLVLCGDGRALVERDSVHLASDGSKIVMRLTTGWLAPAGLQGWADALKVVLLASYVGLAKVDVNLYYDYSSALTSAHATTAANVTASKTGSRVQLLVQPTNTEIEALQVKVTITPDATSAYGSALRLESIALETAAKGIAMPNLPDEART